jgi:hypothetical protein
MEKTLVGCVAAVVLAACCLASDRRGRSADFSTSRCRRAGWPFITRSFKGWAGLFGGRPLNQCGGSASGNGNAAQPDTRLIAGLSLAACATRPTEKPDSPIRLTMSPTGASIRDDGAGPPAPPDAEGPRRPYLWSGLWADIRDQFRRHPILLPLAAAFGAVVITAIATAHARHDGSTVGGATRCWNHTPGDDYAPGTPCLTTPIAPATTPKLHCGGPNGLIRRCDDDDG